MAQDLLQFWHRALASEFGIALTVSDPNIVYELYQARRAAQDPALADLAITKMADGTLWIVKKSATMEDVDGSTDLS